MPKAPHRRLRWFNPGAGTTETTGMDVAAELVVHANAGATGRLDVGAAGVSATIVFHDGWICSVAHTAARPALGMRLVSGGCLSLTNLGSALTVQKQHPGMRLGDVLVRMGLVQRHDVEAVAWEQLCDDVAAMLRWPDPTATFTPMPHDTMPAPGRTVKDVLAAAGTRAQEWQQVIREIGGPDTVPGLSDDAMGTKDVALRPTEWAILCRVDGNRSLQSIADQAGFTTLEAASILQGLLAAGLVTVPKTHLQPHASDRWPAPASPALSAEAPAWTPTPPPPPAPPASHAPAAAVGVEKPPPGPPSFDQFDDPADLLRELSQLGGSGTTSRRGSSR